MEKVSPGVSGVAVAQNQGLETAGQVSALRRGSGAGRPALSAVGLMAAWPMAGRVTPPILRPASRDYGGRVRAVLATASARTSHHRPRRAEDCPPCLV